MLLLKKNVLEEFAMNHFRFPEEIQRLFAYIIEEPLGWPNGGAGDVFVSELEKVIHEHTRFKHGNDAFGQGVF